MIESNKSNKPPLNFLANLENVEMTQPDQLREELKSELASLQKDIESQRNRGNLLPEDMKLLGRVSIFATCGALGAVLSPNHVEGGIAGFQMGAMINLGLDVGFNIVGTVNQARINYNQSRLSKKVWTSLPGGEQAKQREALRVVATAGLKPKVV
jgi:hypothetical protein